mmetsp:Transcript_84225/g.234589  ORF Transcript_84225/g.234589 Transcript_84225/m.234589 type:complete len:220 (+) Transcript_84225:484-1143(+)
MAEVGVVLLVDELRPTDGAARALEGALEGAPVADGALLHDEVVGGEALELRRLNEVRQRPTHAVLARVGLALEAALVLASAPGPRRRGLRRRRRLRRRRGLRGRGRRRDGRRLRGGGLRRLGGAALAVLLAAPLLPLRRPEVLPIVVLGVAIVQPERRVVRLFHLGRGRRPILHSSHLPQGELEVPGAIRVCNVALLEGRDKQGAGGDQHHGTQTAGHC